MKEEETLPQRKWLHHEVPDEVPDPDPVFFITVCCQKRRINQLAKPDSWKVLRESVLRRNQSEVWFCSLFLAMPDHVHGFFQIRKSNASCRAHLAEVFQQWKRWIASELNLVWQKWFFDHRIRDAGGFIEKREYILANPIQAGLVKEISDWPYVMNTLTDKR